MKNRLLLLTLLLAPFFASAQQLKIDSPAELLPQSIYAARNARQTPKGKYCGVLMVHSVIPGLKFEGPTVGDVACQDGIYYVYLAPDASKLKVTNQTGSSISLALPKIQSKATYQVTVYESEARGSLECKSDPSGAQVTLLSPEGNIDLGKTPLRGNIELLAGTYSIMVSKHGFQDKIVKNVKIQEGKKTSLGTVKLKHK